MNAGDLYAHERRTADTEFFWLCATCAATHDLHLDPAGGVSVRPRHADHRSQPPNPDSHLRLVSRSSKPAPRPHSMPSGERTFSLVFDVDPFFTAFRARGGLNR